ncbi:MAG: FecR domain-containing protein [Fuerstiella sp.]
MIDKNELNELFDALSNQAISPTEYERLTELLESSPQVRQSYYRYLELEQRLSEWASIEEYSPKAQFQQKFGPLPESPKPPARRIHKWLRVATVAAGLLAVTFGIMHLQGKREQDSPIANTDGLAIQVASFRQSTDCAWQPNYEPRFDGQQIRADELRLQQGIVEIRLGSGALLVLDGPSRITIQSESQATLHEGHIVMNGDDMQDEFALHTLNAILFDEGTEYGVSVNSKRKTTEVHVFEGRVRVETIPSKPEINSTAEVVMTGSASRIDSAGTVSVPLAAKRFVREISPTRIPSAFEQLIAEEEFQYAGPRLGRANGGHGWAGPWRRDVVKFEPSQAEIVADDSLSLATFNFQGTGGHFLQNGKGSALRPMLNPVRLDIDAEYYLSFLIRKSRESARGVTQYGSVSLRPSSRARFVDSKILFGVSSENNTIMNHNSDQKISAPKLKIGETYCYVARIVARKSSPDRIMFRIYGPEETIGNSTPANWTSESPPQQDNTIYTNLFLYVGGDASFQIDRIRIGSTWRSVTRPQ